MFSFLRVILLLSYVTCCMILLGLVFYTIIIEKHDNIIIFFTTVVSFILMKWLNSRNIYVTMVILLSSVATNAAPHFIWSTMIGRKQLLLAPSSRITSDIDHLRKKYWKGVRASAPTNFIVRCVPLILFR